MKALLRDDMTFSHGQLSRVAILRRETVLRRREREGHGVP